jgi:hypothetical protein
MKQTVDLVSYIPYEEGKRPSYNVVTLRFHPAKRNLIDAMLGRKAQYEGVHKFYVRSSSVRDVNMNVVRGTARDVVLALTDVIFLEDEFSDYWIGERQLPERSLYVETDKLVKGPYLAYWGVYAYPEFTEAPDNYFP